MPWIIIEPQKNQAYARFLSNLPPAVYVTNSLEKPLKICVIQNQCDLDSYPG